MKLNCKWALVLLPLFFAGCEDKIEQPTPSIAYEGDDVRFSVDNSPNSRTMYQDAWDETKPQAIYWGNYVTGDEEFINIYCPDNPGRGFARYKVNPKSDGNSNVAETIVKTSEIGVQWGASGKPYTFYAFYPADRASTTLENGNTIRATVGTGQSPQAYKYAEITAGETSPDLNTLTELESFKTYNEANYNPSGSIATGGAKTIYGMPDMNAAVMVARKTMPAEKFGYDVPLQFKVLADVLDITLNGPVRPNTLNTDSEAQFIQIQAVTIEVVTPKENNSTDKEGNPITDVSKFETDNSVLISGSFDLNMADGTVSNISGNSTVQLQTSMSNADGGVYYPTLFVRKDAESTAYADLDHLRLRAFLIPGQITGSNLNKLRVHLQTNCGDFYQMLENDGNFVTGNIYPVKFGFFKVRGADFDLKAWIGQLNPNIFISELSIPGAWHAANTNYQGSHSLKEMYDAGVRAFEVHTKNGTSLRQAGNMENDFDLSSTTDNFEEPFIRTNTGSPTIKNDVTNVTNGSAESGSWNIDGTTYSYRRPVTGTAGSVEIKTVTEAYTVPKFWLRLYRTQDTSESEPLSDAISNLHSTMNESGIIFLEVGMDTQKDVSDVPYRSLTTTTVTATKTNATVRGYQYSRYGVIWSESYWDTADMSGAQETTDTQTVANGTFTLNGKEAWAIAVRSCFENLADKNIIYDGALTRFTTIAQVKGKIIAKVNTNDEYNEVSYAWGTNTPALFSRWIDGSAKTPLTINLKWKSPVAPYMPGTEEPDSDPDALRWCFSELDNIIGYGSSLKERQDAIKEMNTIAAKNYKGGLHRTFYESSIGGYVSNESDPYGAVAKSLNTFALSRITNPTREAVPLGLVFMNYVIPPTGEETTYNSAALIRAIINNNKAFLLNRADLDTPAQLSKVEDKTNSNFTNTTQNPLK